MKFIKTFIVIGVLCLSIGLLVVSLALPAFYTNKGEDFVGAIALFLGWTMLFGSGEWGYIGWLANLFLPFAWLGLGLSLSKFRRAFMIGIPLSLIAILLSLCSSFIKSINLPGIGDQITSMGIGFYLWLASSIVCAGGYVAVLIIDQIIKRTNVVNKVPQTQENINSTEIINH